MPATYVLIFSLTVHLIDICGNVVECPDDAAERAAFYMLPLVQTTIYAHCRKAHETGVARRRHLPAAVEHKRREAAIDRAIGSVGCQLFCGLFLGPRSAVSQVTRTFPARKKTDRHLFTQGQRLQHKMLRFKQEGSVPKKKSWNLSALRSSQS